MASVKSSSRIRGESTYLFGRDGLLGGLGEFFNGLGVVTKIHLAANKDDGKALAEVKNLGNPLDTVSRMPSNQAHCRFICIDTGVLFSASQMN